MPTIKVWIALALFVSCGCSCHGANSAYRYNPFQFIYPEHHFAAEIAQMPSRNSSETVGSSLEFFGLTAILSPKWDALSKARSIDGDKVVFKTGSDVVMISRQKENLLGCDNNEFREANKDFCSAFGSTEDFFWKLYTLTPEVISKEKYPATGQKWIIHRKGFFFENIERIKIYKGQGVTVYRSDFKPDSRLKTELMIFLKNLQPDHLIISTTINDEEAIDALIASNENIQQ